MVIIYRPHLALSNRHLDFVTPQAADFGELDLTRSEVIIHKSLMDELFANSYLQSAIECT